MINAHDEDMIDKEATLERLKAEVARLAKSFSGITSPDEIKTIVPQETSSAGYFMSKLEDSVEPLA